MKICVYAIAKNEEKFVERFADSTKDADLVVVADTGSVDATMGLCVHHGLEPHRIHISPWRFDHARNAALALLPADIDVCISLDLDEVLEPGWREEIERLWTPGTTRMRYLYDWGLGIKFMTEKIHARHGYYWHHPCHEALRLDLRSQEKLVETPKQLITHLPDPAKSRGQYLDLLALSVKEDPHCPRNAFYYARELTFYCKWDEAQAELLRYLGLPGATWDAERAYAMRLLGRCFHSKRDDVSAEKWWLRAAAETPHEREPWFELTNLYYKQKRWGDCYHTASRALSISTKPTHHNINPDAWGAPLYDFAAIAAWNLSKFSEALAHGESALALAPQDTRLNSNLDWYKRSVK